MIPVLQTESDKTIIARIKNIKLKLSISCIKIMIEINVNAWASKAQQETHLAHSFLTVEINIKLTVELIAPIAPIIETYNSKLESIHEIRT